MKIHTVNLWEKYLFRPQSYTERILRFFSVYLCETSAHLCEAESLRGKMV